MGQESSYGEICSTNGLFHLGRDMYGLMPKREYQGPGRKGEEVGDPAVSE